MVVRGGGCEPLIDFLEHKGYFYNSNLEIDFWTSFIDKLTEVGHK